MLGQFFHTFSVQILLYTFKQQFGSKNSKLLIGNRFSKNKTKIKCHHRPKLRTKANQPTTHTNKQMKSAPSGAPRARPKNCVQTKSDTLFGSERQLPCSSCSFGLKPKSLSDLSQALTS